MTHVFAPEILRDYDIRGTVGTNLSAADATAVGRSFATRRVIAMQKGKPILNLACSFQTPEYGMHHQDAMPDVPAPDTLPSERELLDSLGEQVPAPIRAFLERPRPIELRTVDPRQLLAPEPREPAQAIWFRLVAPIGDDPALHRAILAYASDFALLGTSTLPHGINWLIHDMQTASLDHALWLHEPFRADEWLLYDQSSPSACGSPTLATATPSSLSWVERSLPTNDASPPVRRSASSPDPMVGPNAVSARLYNIRPSRIASRP